MSTRGQIPNSQKYKVIFNINYPIPKFQLSADFPVHSTLHSSSLSPWPQLKFPRLSPFRSEVPSLSLSLSLSVSVSMSFTFINLVLCFFTIIMKMMTMLQMYMLLAHPKPLLQLLAFHFPSFHYVGPFSPLVLRSVSILIIFSMLLVCFLQKLLHKYAT